MRDMKIIIQASLQNNGRVRVTIDGDDLEGLSHDERKARIDEIAGERAREMVEWKWEEI